MEPSAGWGRGRRASRGRGNEQVRRSPFVPPAFAGGIRDDLLSCGPCRFLQGPGTDPRDVSILSRALHTGRDVTVVMRNYRIDGSVFSNEVSISPIRNPTNQITHYIGTQIDVPPRTTGRPWVGKDRPRTGSHSTPSEPPRPGTAA